MQSVSAQEKLKLSIDKMKDSICTNIDEIQLVDNAGHWVQQEQPENVLNLLAAFLSRLD